MKIKNIKVTENLKRLVCVPLVGLIMSTSLSGCSNKATKLDVVEVENYNEKKFDVGEHIISVKISDPTNKKIQYDSHEGYKPIGITSSAYGAYAYIPGEAYIMYSNDQIVNCKPTYKNGEELFYTDFGSPIQYEKEETLSGDNWKEFAPGEHIISVPLEKNTSDNFQVKYYDGYETIGIASSAYGAYAYCDKGGCVLYINNEKVKCIADKDGAYTSFGITNEDTKVLQK